MNLPKKVQVGPFAYSVESDRNGGLALEGSVGITWHHSSRIVIAPGLSLDHRRETLLHEVLHCIALVTGVTNEWGVEVEENIVNRCTPVLLDTLRRNPRLVAYLTEKP